jgi:hypothetical protein
VTDSREQPDRPGHAAPEPITTDPPPPAAVAPLAVTLSDVTFLHWRYDPSVVRPLMPPGTEPDSFDGAAYVGLVAFRMRSYGEFLQLNIRTYSIDQHGRRGVVFLAMEANRLPWVLASRAAGLPYRWSRASLTRHVHELHYRTTLRWPARPISLPGSACGSGNRSRAIRSTTSSPPAGGSTIARPRPPSRQRSRTTVGRCTPLTYWNCTTN